MAYVQGTLMEAATVTWVPVMVVSAPIMAHQMMCPGQLTPLCPGQMTPIQGHMTPHVMQQKVVSPPGEWSAPTKALMDASNVSTNVPSGACSDIGSECDDEEDTAEACAELISQIEAGGAARAAAIEALEGSIQELSFDPSVCRVVQTAFDFADEETAAALAQEMQGSVRQAINSPHANHVIQKILDVLPACHTAFVLDELIGSACEFARHRYGCRVLSRVVRVHSGSSKGDELVDELLLMAAELCRHTFAHYVIESILDTGSKDQLHKASAALRVDLMRNAKNRSATYVVEKAFSCCDDHDCKAMFAELCGTAQRLVSLAENQFGCHVAKGLVRLPGDHFQQTLQYLPEAIPLLQKSKYGRRILEEIKQATQ